MKKRKGLVWRVVVLAPLVLAFKFHALAIDGTFTVTETWSATLTYSNWGDQNYNGTQRFSGTQTGTIVVSGNDFTMLDQTGIPHDPPASISKSRTLQFDGSRYSISGRQLMPYILFVGINPYGIFYLSEFMVRVPLVDGEIPIFYSSTDYGTSGTSLSSLSGSGDMGGSSLTITASSTSTWTLAAGPPIISVNPIGRTVAAGASASFGVSAIGNPAPAYQWQRMPAGSSSWTNLSNGGSYSGVTTPTLTVSGTTAAMNGDQFRCVVSNTQGSIISGAATLTVGSVPVITGQPQNQTVTAGNTATFTATASGSPAPSYQWQRKPAGSSLWNNLSNGGSYGGVATTRLTISSTTTAMSGDQFRCLASNSFGSVTSNPAMLTVNSSAVAPTITVQPRSQTTGAGGTVTFSVSATGTPPLAYQWQKDGVDLPGATTATLTIKPVTLADTGTFTVIVSNSAGSLPSLPATLSVVGDCFGNLPSPKIRVSLVHEARDAVGNPYTYYTLEVTNRSSFPDALFAPASDLPPCGLNTNSSRTWVIIYNEKNEGLYGFCGLKSASNLSNIWFAVSSGQPAPSRVYITLEDRRCATTYKSDLIAVPVLLSGNLLPVGGFQLTVRGNPGAALELQSSIDLIAWTGLARLTNATGVLTYTDVAATMSGRKFYRIRPIQ